MRKQKLIIGTLSLFFSFGSMAQSSDEVDDMYFFGSDAKSEKKEVISASAAISDQPSELATFREPKLANERESIRGLGYTPTFNYYAGGFRPNTFGPNRRALNCINIFSYNSFAQYYSLIPARYLYSTNAFAWGPSGFTYKSGIPAFSDLAFRSSPGSRIGYTAGFNWRTSGFVPRSFVTSRRNSSDWWDRDIAGVLNENPNYSNTSSQTTWNTWSGTSSSGTYNGCPTYSGGSANTTTVGSGSNNATTVSSTNTSSTTATAVRGNRSNTTATLADRPGRSYTSSSSANNIRTGTRSGRSIKAVRTTSTRRGGGFSSSSNSSYGSSRGSYGRSTSSFGNSSKSGTSYSRSSFGRSSSSSSRSSYSSNSGRSSFSSGKSSSSSSRSTSTRSSSSRSSSSKSSSGSRRR